MPQHVRPGHPTRSRRSPGGKQMKMAKPKRPSAATCAICGSKLSGVPRASTVQASKLSRTELRPQRPFGGVLCSSCSRSLYKNKARLKAGAITNEQIDLRQLQYIKQLGK